MKTKKKTWLYIRDTTFCVYVYNKKTTDTTKYYWGKDTNAPEQKQQQQETIGDAIFIFFLFSTFLCFFCRSTYY